MGSTENINYGGVGGSKFTPVNHYRGGVVGTSLKIKIMGGGGSCKILLWGRSGHKITLWWRVVKQFSGPTPINFNAIAPRCFQSTLITV